MNLLETFNESIINIEEHLCKAIASVFALLFVIVSSSRNPLDDIILLSFRYMEISYSSETVDFTFKED